MWRVSIRARVYPTEDEATVRRVIENLFSPSRFTSEEGGDFKILLGASETLTSLIKLREKLRMQRTLDAARHMIKRFSTKTKLTFYLHKQAAYMSYAVFSLPEGESPLGPIEVEVEGGDVRKVLDWLAPPTDGERPKFEVPMPEDP